MQTDQNQNGELIIHFMWMFFVSNATFLSEIQYNWKIKRDLPVS